MVRIGYISIAIVLVLSILLPGCSGEPELSGELTITNEAETAELVLADGAGVVMPPYSVPLGTNVSMRKLYQDEAPPLPEGFDGIGPLYEITVDQPIIGIVTVRIPLPGVVGESVFQFSHYHDGQWQAVPFFVDDGSAVVDTDGLSDWGWLEALEEVRDSIFEESSCYPRDSEPLEPCVHAINPSSGVDGDVVSISGENFQCCDWPRTVNFGGMRIYGDDTISWEEDEIILEVPARTRDIFGRVRLPDDKTVEVKVGYSPNANTVEFTYLEPDLTLINPEFGEPDEIVVLIGKHFGGNTNSAYSNVFFGASRAHVMERDGEEIWEDEEIIVEAPDDYGLGLGMAKDILNAASFAISCGSKTLFDWAIEALDAVTPDVNLAELEWNEDDPLYVQFAMVVAALVGDQIDFCTITVKPSGELEVPVRVETGVGTSQVCWFTYTPSVVEYNLSVTSTTGGSTTPAEGAHAYAAGTVVDLVANPSTGYQFASWTGDVSTIADVNAATTSITMNGDYSITANFEEEGGEEPVYFPDPNLEAAIREAIGKPTGNIYASDLVGLASLWANNRNIANLTGLEYCTSLTNLYLHNNVISDISPLAGLTSLIDLALYGNAIGDVSPLAGLTNLDYLDLYSNQISDISPLDGLTSLTELYVQHNQISDISPLAGLTGLIHLYLSQNQISNISPLAGLTSLTHLYLHVNQISDIEALVNNPGLGAGDEVWLHTNPLSAQSISEYIPALQARGVTVHQ